MKEFLSWIILFLLYCIGNISAHWAPIIQPKQPTGCNCTVAIETLEAARDRLTECRFALDYVELQTMRRDVGKDDLPKSFNRVKR